MLNISHVYFVCRRFPTFSGSPAISLYMYFTGVFTNFHSIFYRSLFLSRAINFPLSCCCVSFDFAFMDFWMLKIVFVTDNFYWVIVWVLRLYAFLIIRCQNEGKWREKHDQTKHADKFAHSWTCDVSFLLFTGSKRSVCDFLGWWAWSRPLFTYPSHR